ncbi:unnamed protein product [Dovyalis caffra]|uniref:Uncharacterized protein n=1 Tax=Dovyalis caffra TaxID=77055 RepID=A0AAV1R1V6_9ROSI|nr:unnamed protein product [Dovyalis caffra]
MLLAGCHGFDERHIVCSFGLDGPSVKKEEEKSRTTRRLTCQMAHLPRLLSAATLQPPPTIFYGRVVTKRSGDRGFGLYIQFLDQFHPKTI